MAEQKVTTIVAAYNPDGDLESVRQLSEVALRAGADAIVILGNLMTAKSSPQQYGAVLKTLGDSQLWIFYVPGPQDAPFHEFLRQAANFEIVLPRLRCVHSTFALANGPIIFSGMGGAIEDDPSAVHDETATLRYPGWEVEYRLKFLHDLKDYPKVLLFTSAPEHKGLHIEGSSVLSEVVKTHNPQFVIVGGEEPKQGVIGAKSHVVAPGSLSTGHYALVNLRKHEVAPGVLRQVRAA